MKRIYWTGICNKERNQATSEIELVISKYGFVADFQRFSDISISLIIEIEERRAELLYNDLKNHLNLYDCKFLYSESEIECTILFNVTFTKGKGDLRIEVPAIPG